MTYRQSAETALASARTHWGTGPNAGATVATVGVGYALLAVVDILGELVATLQEEESECPAGGDHEWGVLEQAGTGRTWVGCENCGAAQPEEEQ